jgi:hypothetical protein
VDKIQEGKLSMREIVNEIVENGRASTQEALENEFEFEASEQGWTDEKIKAAIDSPWFPQI